MSANEYVVIDGVRYAAIALAGETDSEVKTVGAVVVKDYPVRVGDDVSLDKVKVLDGFEYTAVSSDVAVKSSPGYVAGYIVTAGAVSTITLYDNPTAASGDIIHKAAAVDASATSVIVTFPKPIKFKLGLWADIGGASASINVLWV